MGSLISFGFNDLYFGDPIDWQLEPISGKRSDLIHWSTLNYLDADRFGDKKIVWELNRHQYFLTLGQAFCLTGDERYAQTFAQHISQWIDHNQPKLGINWASSLEVSFRSISWLWSLYFFKHSASLTRELFVRIVKHLYLNALHLDSYLSTYFSPNTHLTGEALGLFYIGTFLPELKSAARWRRVGLQILLERINEHVQADGVYFEQSSYYHRYTTDFYLHLKLILDSNNQPVSDKVIEKLQLLLDHLMYLSRPDGTTPLYGDDDGGRLLKLDNRSSNDFRSTLATGAAVFKRGDYKFVAGESTPEALWLVGPECLSNLDAVKTVEPAKLSVDFKSSGLYVMRDSWKSDANYLLFDAGHHGVANCGHAHADALAFDLSAHGKPFLVDPGTYTYTASREMRNWFRGSTAHNTLTLDNEHSSIPAGPFSWQTIAKTSLRCWLSQDRFDFVSASHDGYKRLAGQPIHGREILFIKGDYFIVNDYVEALADHRLQAWFHLDTGIEPLRTKDQSIRLLRENGGGAILQLASFAEHGEWNRESGFVSHCYGLKESAPVFSFSANNASEVTTFLVPEQLGTSHESHVRQIEALHGKAFEIETEWQARCASPQRSGGPKPGTKHRNRPVFIEFRSCMGSIWRRTAAPSPEELVLISGQTIELDGRVLLSRPSQFRTL